MSPGEFALVAVDYHTFMDAQDEWLTENKPVVKPEGNAWKRSLPTTGQTKSGRKLAYRIAWGERYLEWACGTSASASAQLEATSKLRLTEFSRQYLGYKNAVPRSSTMWLKRCILVAEAYKRGEVHELERGHVRLVNGQSQALSGRMRMRRRGLQGRPMKCRALAESLFDWFVSIRSAVTARIPPRLLLNQARAFAAMLLQEMRKTGEFCEVPKIDKHWFRRFKRRYNISMRKPNRRYKCKRGVLLRRLRAMWVTNVRIRALAMCCHGHDLPVVGFDQKGLHFNELGSKNTGTLHFAGAPEVALKENHCATRERFSIMTSVTSVTAEARIPGGGHPWR